MEDYSIGSALADEFDVINQLKYSSSAEVLLRSSNSTVTRPFSADLSPEADHVVAVQFDRDSDTLGAEKDTIAGLFQNWGIPKTATKTFFSPLGLQGLSSISIESIRYCWYHVPVVQFDRRMNEAFNHSLLNVWHVLDTKTSRIRLLVSYPSFMAAPVKAILLSLFSGSLGLGDCQWPQIHLALIRVAIETWEESWTSMMTLALIRLRSMVVAVGKSLGTGPIEMCDEGLNHLNLKINNLVLLEKVMTALCQYFERELPVLPDFPVHPAILLVKNLQNKIDWLLCSYRSLKEDMLLKRCILSTSTEIKNASFVRGNTIALRRTAEQNQIDARQVKLQAELAQKNSQSMTKIAYMTMLYLPANFVATCFSMPFLDLDENHRFLHLKKIWIYVLVSVASTIITFLVSAAWNHLFVGLEKKSTMATGEESLPRNDTKLLEPQSHAEPSPNELAKQVVAALRKGDNQFQDGSNPTSRPSTAEPEDSENSDSEG